MCIRDRPKEARRPELSRGPFLLSLRLLLLGGDARTVLPLQTVAGLLRGEDDLLRYVLHRLHELLLVILVLLLLRSWVAALRRHHRLAHRAAPTLFVELGVGRARFVEVFGARLRHGPTLVGQLQRPFRREPNFVLLLHLVDLSLLLLHDLG